MGRNFKNIVKLDFLLYICIMNIHDKKFMEIVDSLTELTDDPSRGVACLIVKENNIISHGVNVLSRGVTKTEKRVSKPDKYNWISHAERNAIYKAARLGININGARMYCTYFPCVDCARAIIQSGISKIYSPKPDFNHHKWGESWTESIIMFRECGVEVVWTSLNYSYCQSEIEGDIKCYDQCDHCKEYYKPLEDETNT